MSDESPCAPLEVHALALGHAGQTRLNAAFAPGLSLLIDPEGEVKTRLLATLAGQAPVDTGAVRWRGQDVQAAAAAEPALCFWRDPRAPWPDISPVQWAREQAARYPVWREADWQRHVQGWALQEHLHKEMFRLSTGSKRKVLLAAALASGAPLTLIDEPEAALDWSSIRALREAFTQAAPACQTSGRVIVVAHYESIADVPWNQVLGI